MPISTIKYLGAPGKRRVLVLSLIAMLAALFAASALITGKIGAPIQAPQVEPSHPLPAPAAGPDTNTAANPSTASAVAAGHSDLFKAILDQHQNAQPVAPAQPVQQNSQTIQGHSDLFKAILDAHQNAQPAEQPTQSTPQTIQTPSVDTAKEQQNTSPAFPFSSTAHQSDSTNKNK